MLVVVAVALTLAGVDSLVLLIVMHYQFCLLNLCFDFLNHIRIFGFWLALPLAQYLHHSKYQRDQIQICQFFCEEPCCVLMTNKVNSTIMDQKLHLATKVNSYQVKNLGKPNPGKHEPQLIDTELINTHLKSIHLPQNYYESRQN